MINTKHCLYCNKTFDYKRNTKKYCSNGCRVSACQDRKGVEKPAWVNQNYIPKTQPNQTRHAISRIMDSQDLKIQELKARRNYLIAEYQKQLNKTSEFKGKLIGLGAGLFISRNEDLLSTLIITGGTTLLGHVIDNSLTDTPEIQQQKLNLLGYQINDLNIQISQIEIAKRQNNVVMVSTPKTEPKQVENEDLPVIELPKLVKVGASIKGQSITMEQFHAMAKNFDSITLKENYSFLGEPASNFFMTIYGQPGNGKSTWAVEFAHYLSNKLGKVLYNSSEEGLSKSLYNKAKDITNSYFTIGNYRNYNDLETAIKKGYYRFVFIDSINDMKITPQELQELRSKFYKSGFIGILQSTKGGAFKGSNEFVHDSDINIRFENFQPIVEKNRYK